MTDCAKCGACTAVCPVYNVTGRESLTARGKLHLLERLPAGNCSTAFADILSKCLLCGACEEVCARGIKVLPRIVAARQHLPLLVGDHPFLARLAQKTLGTPALAAACSDLSRTIARLLPEKSGLRLRLGLPPQNHPAPPPAETQAAPPQQATVAYFSGCLARYPQPEIAVATEKLLVSTTCFGPHTPAGQVCCGQAAHSSGNKKDSLLLAKRNIAAFADNNLPILTSCASCYSHLASYPELLQEEKEWQTRASAFAARLREFSSFFAAPEELPLKFRPTTGTTAETVLYHDPCHLRFRHHITTPPRHLLTQAGFHLHEPPNGPKCCGMGGLFHLSHPQLAEKISARLLSDISKRTPELVTTTCSGCLIQLRTGLNQMPQQPITQHLAVLLAGKLKT